MRNDDLALAKLLEQRLDIFSRTIHPVPGISTREYKSTFVFQLIESVRRTRFVQEVAKRQISDLRKDPTSELFDPLRAAILYLREGALDEAAWLVFLFVHFGKNAKSGYRLIRDVYGKLGSRSKWDWKSVSKNPESFRHWLDKNMPKLRSGDAHRAFGNHRKYQSLDAWKPNGTGDAIASYVAWVQRLGSHSDLFEEFVKQASGNPQRAFAALYKSMNAVKSFGRTAKFDYLTMIGKLGIAEIQPDSVHFQGATGPVSGAKLMFFGSANNNRSSATLEMLSDKLADSIKVNKQVIEDSLCNWQKSPDRPIRFRG
jgi:hypothetical protein